MHWRVTHSNQSFGLPRNISSLSNAKKNVSFLIYVTDPSLFTSLWTSGRHGGRKNHSSVWQGTYIFSLARRTKHVIVHNRGRSWRAWSCPSFSLSFSLPLLPRRFARSLRYDTEERYDGTERNAKRENDAARGRRRCRNSDAIDGPPLRRLRLSPPEQPAPQFTAEIFGSD